jgi:protein-S-isoprenylcysteine O-methyltransferase Ste14
MIIQAMVVILYLSLVIELTCFHVPSVANTGVFFKDDNEIINQYSQYKWIFSWSKRKKIILLLIPHFINMTVFFIPLFYLLFEETSLNSFSILGLIVAISGRLITFYSMYFIRKNNSQIDNDFTLHDSGPFSTIRNPGMTGMILFFVGLTAIWPSILMVCALIYYIFYNHFRILIEEDFLKVMYKDKYCEYIKKANRYF